MRIPALDDPLAPGSLTPDEQEMANLAWEALHTHSPKEQRAIQKAKLAAFDKAMERHAAAGSPKVAN